MLKSILKHMPRIDSSNRINEFAKSHICEFFLTDEVIENKKDKLTPTVPLIHDDDTTINNSSYYDVQSTENSANTYFSHTTLLAGTFDSKEIVKEINSFANPKLLAITCIFTAIFSFRNVTGSTITINVDMAIIISCMLLVIGRHFPPMTKQARHDLSTSPGQIAKKESVINSIRISILGEEPMDKTLGPLARIPHGVKLGNKHNCWSEPPSYLFKVKGLNYLKDKTKIGSGPFLFPIRGVDLFLTDDAPENVGK